MESLKGAETPVCPLTVDSSLLHSKECLSIVGIYYMKMLTRLLRCGHGYSNSSGPRMKIPSVCSSRDVPCKDVRREEGGEGCVRAQAVGKGLWDGTPGLVLPLTPSDRSDLGQIAPPP